MRNLWIVTLLLICVEFATRAEASADASAAAETVQLTDCYACGSWSNWGERQQVCAVPSEQLLQDALACFCDGACAAACSEWCTSLDTCEAANDPACMPTDTTGECTLCTEGIGIYAGIGCRHVTEPCSLDTTGCIQCGTWLTDGKNPNLLCWAQIPTAVALSDCACAECAACASACAQGYLDVSAASFACGVCLSTACAAELSTCTQ